jgi:hypothetical protein
MLRRSGFWDYRFGGYTPDIGSARRKGGAGDTALGTVVEVLWADHQLFRLDKPSVVTTEDATYHGV